MEIFEILPYLLLSKREVNGYKVNPEVYLIELLNSSSYFMAKTDNKKFIQIKEQSNGESDAKAGCYEIDFKLLIPSKYMHNKSKALPDVDYSHTDDGMIFIKDNEASLSKKFKNAEKHFINYIAKISLLNKETLINMKGENTILKSAIKDMSFNKNILAFIPCVFTTDINCIALIKKLFNSLFGLRDEIDKDTYIVYLKGNDFQILKYNKGTYSIVDSIHKTLIPTFIDIYRLTYFI